MVKSTILVGAHMSITGGLYKAIDRAEEVGCATMQIFTKNSKSWSAPALTKEEITLFKDRLKTSQLSHIMVHTSYLINLGSKNEDVTKKSITALKQELIRCEQLGIPYLILHPGSHVGLGEEASLAQISHNLDIVLSTATGETQILLETMSGQGTAVAYKFEQLKKIYDMCVHKKLVGVCLDTCHVFAAGYDLSSPDGYRKTWSEFRSILGIRLLKAIHLNDSKTKCGSKLDRHESLGKGEIGLPCFKLIMNDPALKNIPKVLETPDSSLYKEEIALLKRMAKL